MWGVLFFQEHQAKRKQDGILKADKTRISTSNFDTKDCAVLLRIILTVNNSLVENCDRYQLLDYSELKQDLCALLKLLKNQIYAGQSVIYTEMIKYKRVCILM